MVTLPMGNDATATPCRERERERERDRQTDRQTDRQRERERERERFLITTNHDY
jgi:hypothetical protein